MSEIFYSIQGEGVNVGRPSVFVRLGLCNLRCVWCDTKYTWLFSEQVLKVVKENAKKLKYKETDDFKVYSMKKELRDMTPKEVYDEIKKYNCKRVVVTGGEPLLQQGELIELLKLLNIDNYFIEVETNGTISPTHDLKLYVNQFNVSPKLKNSGNELSMRIKDSIKDFVGLNSFFKFVINDKKDLKEVLDIIEKYKIPPNTVILMPQATTQKELRNKMLWLIEICKDNNFIVGNRLQIEVWGKTRGV